MIHVLSGSSKAAGVIRVSYPANSTLVITGTSSGKQFAKDTNTTSSAKAYIFLAPIGDASYTLTATNTAGKTVSKQVYVAKDQVQSVVLAYFSATIKVTYPAKSTCVIKNSSGTQVGSDTNTGTAAKTWTATVDASGTYTITATATDGSGKTKTTTASITANGQSVSVTLAYEFVIYQNGSFGKNSAGTAFDAKNTDDNNASSITKNSAYMLWTCGAWAVCTFYITPKFSCAGYKTLKISVTNASTVLDSSSKGAWGLKSGNSYDNNDFVAQTNFTSLSGSQTLSLDVSNVGSTAYYIAMYFYTAQNTGSFSARVTKIWLE